MPTHSIRLRGPWQIACFDSPPVELSAIDTLLIANPVELPFQIHLHHRFARFLRYFNCPTGLQSHDQVFVVLHAVGVVYAASVDETSALVVPVGQDHFEFDVTQRLSRRHLLSIDLRAAEVSPGSSPDRQTLELTTLHSVRVEIRSASDL